MAKAYWVVCYRSIANPAARAEYTKLAVPAVLACGGRTSPSATPPRRMRPGSICAPSWSSSRVLPRRSPPTKSPGYQAALAVLGNAAERDLRIVEGVD
jgi:uncharacterized protein (DUF1330 family)